MSSHHFNSKRFAYILALVSLGMLGLSFAAVPLYRLICQKTGFGGTPQVGLFKAALPLQDHFVTVTFTATTSRDLPWAFTPKNHQLTAKIGEPTLTSYRAKNLSQRPIVGMATYNVSPDKTGIYFGKIQCFCFEPQKLDPGQEMDMPVLFTISPDILKDPLTANVKRITLSYTFFEYKS